jgi:hypothetical protein
VNAVNFPGKRQSIVGLGTYVAKLDIRCKERIELFVVLRVVMKKEDLDFFCRVLYIFSILVGQKWHVVGQLL